MCAAGQACIQGACVANDNCAGLQCAQGTICVGGTCVGTFGCHTDTDCGGGTACQTPACIQGQCALQNVALGAPLASQIPGDCKTAICDGAGHISSAQNDADTPVGGQCMVGTCNKGGPSFTPVPAGTSCNQSGGTACDGTGNCVSQQGLAQGQACASDSACGSGFCTDGVCCDTACNGTCQACSAAKKGSGFDGTCGNIAAGTNPDNECAAQPATSCGTTGFCSGAGTCQLYAAGTSCAAATCSNGFATAPASCTGTGTCAATTSTSCGPYACGTIACLTSCTTDANCSAGSFCKTATAQCQTRLANGATCTANNACQSGNCQGGVCQAACTGGTSSCGSACVNLATDINNCGACGQSCGAGAACFSGACVCGAGQHYCDGVGCLPSSLCP
jgi:hypothetical protein